MKPLSTNRIVLALILSAVFVLGGCDLFNNDTGGGNQAPDEGDQAAIEWTPSTHAA